MNGYLANSPALVFNERQYVIMKEGAVEIRPVVYILAIIIAQGRILFARARVFYISRQITPPCALVAWPMRAKIVKLGIIEGFESISAFPGYSNLLLYL